MKFGSLFSGIGGIDLGLERAGMTCVWQSEIEPYACQVLKKHWPDIPNLGDIRDIDWTTVERADVVAGGYPCQPFSIVGHRKGADDPRHLWPMFAECLRVVRPRFALLENVASHLNLGFGSVLADLAALGYDARWDCIPARAVGASHYRDRVFVVAHTGCERLEKQWISPSRHESGKPSRSADETRRSEIGRWLPEPSMGRVAYGISRRVDRLRGLGNAVVPQVAEHIGNIIMEANNDR